MRRKIVIHPGFHKTGTTTLQKTLRANGRLLWPVMAIGLRHQLEPTLQASRAYSTWGNRLSLIKFRRRFSRYIQSLDLGEKRRLCISSEELAGHLPGRGKIVDYGALPQLMKTMSRVLERRLGPDIDLSFFITTRAPGDWLRSAYWEHVKSAHMQLDFTDFRTRYAAASDHGPIIEALRRAVAPHQVVTAPLERCNGLRLGPADPLLDMLDIPDWRRRKLVPQAPRNAFRGDEVLQALLEINRTTGSSDEARPLKQAYLAELDNEHSAKGASAP